MKVSIFVHDLSSNPIVRVYPIAKALEKLGYEVEVLGFLINANKIYEPYKDEFNYITERSNWDIRVSLFKAFRLASKASGNIIYAFKPKWTTLFPALLASGFGFKKKLILDAEDNELWDAFIGNGFKEFFKSPYYVESPIYNKLMHPFTWLIHRKTVVCSSLQKRYGGVIVLHGPDSGQFNPNNVIPSVNEIRKEFGLPVGVPLVLFAGRPLYFHNFNIIVEAFKDKEIENWHLVLAGDSGSKEFNKAKEELKSRCHLLGFVQHKKMPELLKAVDVVPVIQKPNPATQMEIPAKLLEAMSMGKAIISTRVADIPFILGENSNSPRGWLIDPENPQELVTVLKEIFENKNKVDFVIRNAREYFLKNASCDAIASKIKHLFE